MPCCREHRARCRRDGDGNRAAEISEPGRAAEGLAEPRGAGRAGQRAGTALGGYLGVGEGVRGGWVPPARFSLPSLGSPWSVADILAEDDEQDRVPLQKLKLLGEPEGLEGVWGGCKAGWGVLLRHCGSVAQLKASHVTYPAFCLENLCSN